MGGKIDGWSQGECMSGLEPKDLPPPMLFVLPHGVSLDSSLDSKSVTFWRSRAKSSAFGVGVLSE